MQWLTLAASALTATAQAASAYKAPKQQPKQQRYCTCIVHTHYTAPAATAIFLTTPTATAPETTAFRITSTQQHEKQQHFSLQWHLVHQHPPQHHIPPIVPIVTKPSKTALSIQTIVFVLC